MTKEEAIETLNNMPSLFGSELTEEESAKAGEALSAAVIALQFDPADVEMEKLQNAYDEGYKEGKRSLEAYSQIKWERDTAIEQLKELGYSLGEKIKPAEKAETPLEYMEYAYAGARACDDVAEQVRLARAIAAYKQDVHEDCTVLDKIRAEIENLWKLKKSQGSPFYFGLGVALDVIDKYKAESEE